MGRLTEALSRKDGDNRCTPKATPSATAKAEHRDESVVVEPLAPLDVVDAVFADCRDDSLIAIASRRPERNAPDTFAIKALAPVPVAARYDWLPEVFRHQLEHTQYFMVNTLDQRAVRRNWTTRRIGEHACLSWFDATNANVRELSAILLDLDVWRADVPHPYQNDPAEALGHAVTLWLKGRLPMPAMAAFSGRGAYLLWLLADERAVGPPLATPDNRECWRLIASELSRRLVHLGADQTWPAHWYKRPGTRDFRTGEEVKYMFFAGSKSGAMRRHRLSDLQQLLGVYHCAIDARGPPGLPCSPSRHRKKPQNRLRNVRRGKGGEPHRRRCIEIERLSAHRGGIREGRRAVATWTYFLSVRAWLRTCGDGSAEGRAEAHREALEKTVAFAGTFQPPLTPEEVRRQVQPPRSATAPRYWRGSTVAKMFAITPAEVAALDLEAVVPADIAARRKVVADAAKDARRSRRAARREPIVRMIRAGLSDATIADRLKLPSPMTAWRVRKSLPAEPLPLLDLPASDTTA